MTYTPTPEAVEAAARALAGLGPGEDWPTNEALGGGLTGARDDEYRAEMEDAARRALTAAGPIIAAEALEEAAAEVDRIDPTWDSALCIDRTYHPVPTWLRDRAARLTRGEGS